jgi:hypothetical protein
MYGTSETLAPVIELPSAIFFLTNPCYHTKIRVAKAHHLGRIELLFVL